MANRHSYPTTDIYSDPLDDIPYWELDSLYDKPAHPKQPNNSGNQPSTVSKKSSQRNLDSNFSVNTGHGQRSVLYTENYNDGKRHAEFGHSQWESDASQQNQQRIGVPYLAGPERVNTNLDTNNFIPRYHSHDHNSGIAGDVRTNNYSRGWNSGDVRQGQQLLTTNEQYFVDPQQYHGGVGHLGAPSHNFHQWDRHSQVAVNERNFNDAQIFGIQSRPYGEYQSNPHQSNRPNYPINSRRPSNYSNRQGPPIVAKMPFELVPRELPRPANERTLPSYSNVNQNLNSGLFESTNFDSRFRDGQHDFDHTRFRGGQHNFREESYPQAPSAHYGTVPPRENFYSPGRLHFLTVL